MLLGRGTSGCRDSDLPLLISPIGRGLSAPFDKLTAMQDITTPPDTTFALDSVSFRVPGRTLLHPLSLTFPDKTCVSQDTAFQGFPPNFHQGLSCCKEFHHKESMALNTQQGICHQDKNWDPAWEDWPRTQGGSIGTINGKNI